MVREFVFLDNTTAYDKNDPSYVMQYDVDADLLERKELRLYGIPKLSSYWYLMTEEMKKGFNINERIQAHIRERNNVNSISGRKSHDTGSNRIDQNNGCAGGN